VVFLACVHLALFLAGPGGIMLQIYTLLAITPSTQKAASMSNLLAGRIAYIRI